MARRNRNKLLVPEARQALNQFKAELLARDDIIPEGTKPSEVSYQVAKGIGVPMKKRDNGNLTTKDAGKVGGQIGGRMVKELVRIAQEQLVRKERH